MHKLLVYYYYFVQAQSLAFKDDVTTSLFFVKQMFSILTDAPQNKIQTQRKLQCLSYCCSSFEGWVCMLK